MNGMDPRAPLPPRRPDHEVPGRPDLLWTSLPPAIGPRRRRRGMAAVVALITAIAIMGSLGLVGGVVADLSRPKGTSDEYRFLATAGGKPVRWNPCEPIHYVVNLQEAPAGASQDVQEAISRVSVDTGVTFVFDGSTSEIPQSERLSYLPALYGERWAPVVIAWVYQSQTDIPFHEGEDQFAAVSRPLAPLDRTPQFVSGWVAINAADHSPPGWATPASEGPTILHELGHIMGLDHVASKAELMEPSGGYVTDYGPGDLAGLELLGRDQGCLREPAVP
jgi:hypothetical protein